MIELLQEFYRDKSFMRAQHVAAAQSIGDYDFNNTYQYVIAREDMHLRWLIDAITNFGAQPVDVPGPRQQASGGGKDAQRQAIAGDRDTAQRFMDKWRSRV